MPSNKKILVLPGDGIGVEVMNEVLNLIDKNYVKSVHDISLGGIMIAIAKMCIKGKKGIVLKKPNYLINQFEYFFEMFEPPETRRSETHSF